MGFSQSDLGLKPGAPRAESDSHAPAHTGNELDRTDPDRCGTVGVRLDPVVHGADGKRVVAHREVELNPTGDPCATQCDQRRFDHAGTVEDVPAPALVERVEMSAQFGEAVEAQELILQHH